MIIIAGIIIVLFYRQLARGAGEFYHELFHMPRFEKVNEIGFLAGGILFILFGVDDLVGLSANLTLMLILGILLTRLFREAGRASARFLEKFIHIRMPVMLNQILCLLLGVFLIVVGVLDVAG
jgi:hypothetical protein